MPRLYFTLEIFDNIDNEQELYETTTEIQFMKILLNMQRSFISVL